MRRLIILCASVLAVSAALAAGKPIRFWNLAMQTVTSLQLAKTGAQDFGPDLCKADKDGSVEHDERLNLPTVVPGTYDAKIGYADGRTCVVKGLTLEAGKVFSVEEKQLTACTK
ncbi:MAG: hypothetical protein ACLP8A_15655 [Methylovirgula sp.]